MYQGEEPLHHHPSKMDDHDDDYDDNHQHHPGGYDPHPPPSEGHHQGYDPHAPYPPPSQSHHQGYDPHRPHTPPPQGHLQPPPPETPQQPLQPQHPSFNPRSRPPSKKHANPPPPYMSMPPPHQQPLQPPQQMFHPTSPPPKPRPPPHRHHGNNPYNHENNRSQHLFAVITIILILLGLTALIIWLLYRPSKPHFTAISAAIYFLNTTTSPPYIAASIQLTVLTHNPSKRTSLYYDNLAVAVQYCNLPITPPVAIPPLHHMQRSTVMLSPAVGGGPAVAVPPEVAEELAMDKANGVVGLSWVLVGKVKYRAGWFRSGHNRVYVKCDFMVQYKNGGGNSYGQVPLLGNPPCFVDM